MAVPIRLNINLQSHFLNKKHDAQVEWCMTSTYMSLTQGISGRKSLEGQVLNKLGPPGGSMRWFTWEIHKYGGGERQIPPGLTKYPRLTVKSATTEKTRLKKSINFCSRVTGIGYCYKGQWYLASFFEKVKLEIITTLVWSPVNFFEPCLVFVRWE